MPRSTLLIAVAALAVVLIGVIVVAQDRPGGVGGETRVDAPAAHVESGDSGTRVDAPGTSVETGDNGTRVQAPGVDITIPRKE